MTREERLEKYRAAKRDYMRRYRENNWEKDRADYRARYAANPQKFYDRVQRRHEMRRQRTPTWANRKELAAVYAGCPEFMVVDHIVPLDGVTAEGYPVTGLHIPWNLQVLTPSQNSLKGSRMRPEDSERAENGIT